MIVSIIGPDGSGKTTVTQRLAKNLKNRGIPHQLMNKWDIFDLEKHPECRFVKESLSLLRECISEMRGPGRILLIYWTLYTAMSKTEYRSDTIYILDGYWEKHAAIECIFGHPEDWLLNLVALMPKADLNIFLDASTEQRYMRKAKNNDFVPYECGLDKSMSEESFVSHQRRLLSKMNEWCKKLGWTKIDANKEADRVYHDVESLIMQSYELEPFHEANVV